LCRLTERSGQWLPNFERVYGQETDPELRREMGEWLWAVTRA
jgi:hypothetical protein